MSNEVCALIDFNCVRDQRVTSRYGERIHPVTKVPSFHIGIDLVGGVKIKSPLPGGVIVGMGFDSLSGYWCKVAYPGDIIISFCHLHNAVAPKLMNYKLEENEWFAIMGSTGRSTGTHLHLTIRFKGEIINPEALYKF